MATMPTAAVARHALQTEEDRMTINQTVCDRCRSPTSIG